MIQKPQSHGQLLLCLNSAPSQALFLAVGLSSAMLDYSDSRHSSVHLGCDWKQCPESTHVFGEQESVAAGGCCTPHCGIGDAFSISMSVINESPDFCHHLLLINPLPPAPDFASRLCVVQPETQGLQGVPQGSLSGLNFSPVLTGKLGHTVWYAVYGGCNKGTILCLMTLYQGNLGLETCLLYCIESESAHANKLSATFTLSGGLIVLSRYF